MRFWGYLLLSFLVMSLGQPTWVAGLGVFAGAGGLALFWGAMREISAKRDRFFLALFWFAAVQGVHLSWMTSLQYMGLAFLLVYGGILLWLGAQFALLSLGVPIDSPLRLDRCFALAGVWVFLEASRLFLLTGFTWNPLGLCLAGSHLSLQWASLFGVYGLSFWVVLVNLFAYRAFFLRRRAQAIGIWILVGMIPYVYGEVYQILQAPQETTQTLSVALVQTELLPEQREYYVQREERYIPPLEQWKRIYQKLDFSQKVDLVVLPEAALSGGLSRYLYPWSSVSDLWTQYVEGPYFAEAHQNERKWVDNSFLIQQLSTQLNAHIIIGLDDSPYNAAFHFCPKGGVERYEKQILVPVGEYIPFTQTMWVHRLLSKYFGISGSFEKGTQTKVFHFPIPTGISICLEETYPSLLRQARQKGAELFVNVSNDAWFPQSKLPELHWQHARLRAVENGVCVLRSCNTGVTGALDCFGRSLGELPVSESNGQILYLSIPIMSLKTLYTYWGDYAIFLLSLFAILGCLVKERFSFTEKKEKPFS